MNIFVGNLAPEVSEDDLKIIFEPFGKVSSIKIIKDIFTGVSKGFGFVEMPSNVDGNAAIKELIGKNVKGKVISVNEARPQRNNRRGSKKSGGSRKQGGGRRRF